MSFEYRINYELSKYPVVKKIVKRLYQMGMYTISPKIKSEGNISCILSDNKSEYFFGYYDKSPWDASGRYMLCMRAKNTWSIPDPIDEAEIILIDTEDRNRFRVLEKTHTWNVQQGCMAQWLGPSYDKYILYNDLREGKYCSIILDVFTGEKRVLPMPIYTVSADGNTALSLDFSRLHSLRLGYGYASLADRTKGIALPDEACIWKIDIRSGEITELLKYTDFAKFYPRKEMQKVGTIHKVNHLMFSPNGKRFLVLYRWFNGNKKYSRLITCDVDGTDMFLLNDDDMVSHCFWKDDKHIIAFENKRKEGIGYYLMTDKSQDYVHLWPKLNGDGHPSYCPTDNSKVVFDTYPNRVRIQEIKIARDSDIEGNNIKTIVRVFAPFKYDNDTRCDLHPRWSRNGKSVCFDACFEGHRGLYVVSVE